jgi:hypothetical protein
VNENHFKRLRAIDVGEHLEKKNGLSYLSWAWALDRLLQEDPDATWEFLEPSIYPDGTMMLWCRVTAFGKTNTMFLPVMNHKNQAVANPDAFTINKNMMRLLAKAIATHGLGLYVYAGEDMPEEVKAEQKENTFSAFRNSIEAAYNRKQLTAIWDLVKPSTLTADQKSELLALIKTRVEELKQISEAA